MREPWFFLNDIALRTLSRGYLDENATLEEMKETAIARYHAMAEASHNWLIKMGRERKGHKEKLIHGWSRGWASVSTPIMGNFGLERGLPISCNGSYVGDSVNSIIRNQSEIGHMTRHGAGTSSFIDVRPKGSKVKYGGVAAGAVPIMGLHGAMINTISQSGLRRGNWAGYISIRSDDIHDFIRIRDPLHPVQHVSFGVCIDDDWMLEMLEEPVGGAKRMLMVDIILKRRASGFPYIIFTDAANRARHPRLKELNLKILASNLCTEIMLHATEDESFVCDLASVNALYFDEWKDTDWIETQIYTLDTVMEEYIFKTNGLEGMERPNRYARRWRSLGLGTLGYHSALQDRMLPFESIGAREFNIELHTVLRDQSLAASKKMAEEYGEPEGMIGTGQRHAALNAIAPTQSSSIILGQVSQSIEPWEGNIFENDNAKSVFTMKNPILTEILEDHGKNTPEVWKAIAEDGGSVQKLPFLTKLEKDVFKIFREINPMETIIQNADRTPLIDQGVSFNMMVANDADMQTNMMYIIAGWKLGQKSFYYHKNASSSARSLLRQTKQQKHIADTVAIEDTECVACEA